MNKCKIVQDLWPLYLDGEISEESKDFIDEHLQKCKYCQTLENNHQVRINLFPAESDRHPGNAEKFLLRLKRRLKLISGGVLLFIILTAGVSWHLGKWISIMSYKQQMEDELKFHLEQLSLLETLSPPAKKILSSLGINFSFSKAQLSGNNIAIAYNLKWAEEIPVKWIIEDKYTGIDTVMNYRTEEPVLQGSTRNSSNNKGEYAVIFEALLRDEDIADVMFKTSTLYAFMKPPEVNFNFLYTGERENINIEQVFSYDSVDFSIDMLQLSEEEFVVQYRQLTPVEEVGVYLLNFAFVDHLGREWTKKRVADLYVENPKMFSLFTSPSPNKNWIVKLQNVIKVIPPLDERIVFMD